MKKIAYYVISVDLSTKKLSVVVTDHTGKVAEVQNYMLSDNTQRRYHDAYRVGRNLSIKYRDKGRVYAFPEKPIAWRSSRATLALAGVAASLIAGFVSGRADVIIEANNQTWKADVVGGGKVDKPKIAAHVKKHWPSMYEFVLHNFKRQPNGSPDQDLMDSACINIYGQQIIERMIRSQGQDFSSVSKLKKRNRSK